MQREDMVCANCLNFAAMWTIHKSGTGPTCHLNPVPLVFTNDTPPKEHWCAQGHWQGIAKHLPDEILDYYWGEWDE